MAKKIRIIVYGIGAMGSGAARLMLQKEWIELVGAICRAYPDPKDAAKVKAGKDLGDVAGVGRKLGIIVSDNPDAVLRAKADVVIHATSSPPHEIEAQIIKCVEAGSNVISMAETRLVHPWVHDREFGQRIDEAAKKHGVTVLATGINPGFMMDLVPVTFTGICASIRKITLTRLLNIAYFGAAVSRDIGIGLTLDEFKKRLAEGTLGWIMPLTSPQIDMLADALGWKLDKTTRTAEPMTSKKVKKTAEGARIEPGKVMGVKWTYTGMKGGEAPVTFDWIQVMDPEEEGLEVHNRILIEGEPNVEVVVRRLRDDIATYAHAVNHIPQVLAAPPGLLTVRELPVATVLNPSVPPR